MILQLNPTISLDTPKGPADAHFMIDYGLEAFLLWVCFIRETGVCWTFRNDQIRLERNDTMGIRAGMTKEEVEAMLNPAGLGWGRATHDVMNDALRKAEDAGKGFENTKADRP